MLRAFVILLSIFVRATRAGLCAKMDRRMRKSEYSSLCLLKQERSYLWNVDSYELKHLSFF